MAEDYKKWAAEERERERHRMAMQAMFVELQRPSKCAYCRTVRGNERKCPACGARDVTYDV